MSKAEEGTKIAKSMMSGFRYLYGGNGQNYTKSLVNQLAKQYPSKYTAEIKKEALKDADKGFKAGDCSYFVCKAIGIARTDSATLKKKATKAFEITKANAKEGMILWKSGHVAYIGDGLKVYEFRSTKADATVSSFETRAKDFAVMCIVKGSFLDQDLQKAPQEPKTNYYPATPKNWKGTSIVAALAAVGEKDTSMSHRKKIAAANNIKGYIGSAAQNLQLVALIKAGKLIKC